MNNNTKFVPSTLDDAIKLFWSTSARNAGWYCIEIYEFDNVRISGVLVLDITTKKKKE